MKNFWVSLMIATFALTACTMGDEAIAQTTQKTNSATEPSKATKPVNQPRAATSTRAQATPKEHRVVIQVTQNEPTLMNIALNNAQNLINHYQSKGEHVEIEFVAYGPGLHMLRGDTSPVKDRLSTFALQHPKVVFSGCGNTLNNQSKQEGKEISLVSEARIVQTGIARVMELQEQGWSYVRP
jgi:intracellular sulfur oxidation DsrE/DsrF family protein